MSKAKRLSRFECGFIAAIASLVHGHGAGTEALELYSEIGSPTPAQVKRAGLGEYEIEAITTLQAINNEIYDQKSGAT